MDWHIALIVIHLIGTVLGVGAATFAEIFFLKSARDGNIDPTEGSFLQIIYRVMRIALFLLVLSGFGFLVLYRLTGLEDRLYSPLLWAKMSIVVIILANAILLQTRRVPMWLGSALSFSSWYAAMLLIPLRTAIMPISYLEIMMWYGVSVLAVAGILSLIRRFVGIEF